MKSKSFSSHIFFLLSFFFVFNLVGSCEQYEKHVYRPEILFNQRVTFPEFKQLVDQHYRPLVVLFAHGQLHSAYDQAQDQRFWDKKYVELWNNEPQRNQIVAMGAMAIINHNW